MTVLLTLFWALTGPASDLFARANAAYEAARFEEAVVLYDSTLLYCRTAAVYYNRGNAHFKANRIGAAIADYLRAWSLGPRDRDIRYNLNFARQFRVDKNQNPEGLLSRVSRSVFTFFNPAQARLIAVLLFFLAALFLAGFFLLRHRQLLIAGLMLALLFFWALGSVFYWRGATSPNIVVVIVPELILRAGPGDEYKEIAAVHDGLEAKIVERRQEWLLIQIPGGLGGWVRTGTVQPVFE
jgi:tetratricopeptide (TPR) repeat protein